MATSIQHNLVSTVENEISCPICFEDFEEPKCLPNCAHNVCQHCLEGMVKKRNMAIQCPVCRVESVIPQGGVAAFPKNHLLVRLIEQVSPGRKEKQSLKQALKNCKEKLEGTKAALGELEGRYVTTNVQDEKTKKGIQSLAEIVVKTARDHERKLLGEIQSRQDLNKKKYESHKSRAAELCENAHGCIHTVQEILENGELSDLKNLKDPLLKELNDFSKCLEESLKLGVNWEFTQPSVVSLTETNSVEKFIESQCPLGSGPNWQGMEVTFRSDYKNEEPEHVVFLSKSSASKDVNSVDLLSSLSKEDLKIYSRIKKLLEEKPKGLWLKRVGAEYKKLYNQALPNEKLERLKELPSIARCEEFPGGNTIVYPSRLECHNYERNTSCGKQGS